MQYEIHGEAGDTRLKAHGVIVYSEVPNGKPMRIPDALREALLPYLKTPPGDPPHDPKNPTP